MALTFTLNTVLYQGKEQLRITFPFSNRALACIRSFPGARWSPELNAWHLSDLGSVPALLSHIRSAGFEVSQSGKSFPADSMLRFRSGPHPEAERFRKRLEAGMYPRQTLESYVAVASEFLRSLKDVPLAESRREDADAFLMVLWLRRKLFRGTYLRAVDALEHLAAVTPGISWGPGSLHRPDHQHRAPGMLSTGEVSRLLNRASDLRERTILGLLYGCGLRYTELAHLLPDDVLPASQQLVVGGETAPASRIVPMPDRLFGWVRGYLQEYCPARYLFESSPGYPLNPRNISLLLRKARDKAGVNRKVGLRTLRYSYAGHLLDIGANPRRVAELLGYGNPGGTVDVPGAEPSRLAAALLNRVFPK